jgi:hypothetical protein
VRIATHDAIEQGDVAPQQVFEAKDGRGADPGVLDARNEIETVVQNGVQVVVSIEALQSVTPAFHVFVQQRMANQQAEISERRVSRRSRITEIARTRRRAECSTLLPRPVHTGIDGTLTKRVSKSDVVHLRIDHQRHRGGSQDASNPLGTGLPVGDGQQCPRRAGRAARQPSSAART